jgi:RecA/RadA recombinase
LTNRGIDPARFHILPVNTIEDFSQQCLSFLNKYLTLPEKDRPGVMIVLDSLGNLSTNKELTDLESGNDKVDFTKAKKIRACFRAITQPLGRANIPFLLTNHIYKTMDAYDFDGEMGGGGGAKYACSSIVWLKKKKDVDAKKTQVGNIIRCGMFKSRLTREKLKGETRILFEGGLDRYHGLFDIAVAAGVVQKPLDKETGERKEKSTFWELPDGKNVYESKIKANPEILYTPDVLTKLDEYVKLNFKYVSNEGKEEDDSSEKECDND